MRYFKGYPYQLAEEFSMVTPLRPAKDIDLPFIHLATNGVLTGKLGFAWDGASGAVDTDALIVPTFFHDVGYQLLRLGLLDPDWKEAIDDFFIELYNKRVDMLPWYKRWFGEGRKEYIHMAVDLLGKSSTLAENKREVHYVF